MQVRKLSLAGIDPEIVAEAAAIIRRGGLVAFPTETVYGLGADATNAEAVAAIFTAKGRPSYNPLIVHVRDVTAARRYVTAWPESAEKLAKAFWPGPLTLVLPKDSVIPDIVTAGLSSVGIRVPAHPVALALLRAADRPIAAPSANRSMRVSPTAGEHVASSLGSAADMILDAGPSEVGIESTVIDLTGAVPTILRPGMISLEELAGVLGRVENVKSAPRSGEAHPSPGMMDRHYSPNARLIMTDAPGAAAVRDLVMRHQRGGAKVVALTRSPLGAETCTVWRMPESAADYARSIYATLHRVDAEGFDVVVVESLPDDAAWHGLRDRLRRAQR